MFFNDEALFFNLMQFSLIIFFTPGVVSATNSHGEILKYQLLASSSLPDSPPSQATLGQRSSTEMTGAWRPEVNDKNQFLEIDLGTMLFL